MLYDEDVERQVLGGMIELPNHMHDILSTLNVEDFYKPTHQTLFTVIDKMWANGEPFEPALVTRRVQAEGRPSFTGADLMDIKASASLAPMALLEVLVDLRIRRSLMALGKQMVDAAQDPASETADVMGHVTSAFGGMEMASTGWPENIWLLPEFVDRPEDEVAPWVVPGMMREGWRALVVASEGAGKMVLFRQLVIGAAAGIHPFRLTPIEPVVSLLVDLENPVDAITETSKMALRAVTTAGVNVPEMPVFIWHEPGGIDIRSRKDFAKFDAWCGDCKPKLVCLGPLYKAFRNLRGETLEDGAMAAMQRFDDLRTRHGFALMIEHHAGKASGGFRDLVPFGSSAWLRWPELGIRLTADGVALKVERWRPDRVKCEWPDRLTRGGYTTTWPWSGSYNKGMK